MTKRVIAAIIAVLVILILGGYLFKSCITSSTDKKFDEAERAKLEQVQRDEVDSAEHERTAKAQEQVITALQTQVDVLQRGIDSNNTKINTLRRSQRDVEKNTQASIDVATGDMDIASRCLRVCENAKSLGLINPTTQCDCH